MPFNHSIIQSSSVGLVDLIRLVVCHCRRRRRRYHVYMSCTVQADVVQMQLNLLRCSGRRAFLLTLTRRQIGVEG